MKKQTKKAIGVVGLSLALVGAGVAGGFILDQPQTIVQHDVQVKTVEVPTPYVVEKIVEKNVTQTEYVEDDSFKQMACDRLFYEDVTDCQKEVEAEDSALKLALEKLSDEKEVFDLLEDEGLINDEDEARIIRVYDDYEDIKILKSDYDDEEYRFAIKVRVEDEDADEKFNLFFEIDVDNGEVEITDVYGPDKASTE